MRTIEQSIDAAIGAEPARLRLRPDDFHAHGGQQADRAPVRRNAPTEPRDVQGNDLAMPPRMVVGSASSLWSPLDRRVVQVMARARLLGELRSIVFDLIGPCEPDELPAEMAAWVEDTMARVVSDVCDRSMSMLIRSLESTLKRAPSEVMNRLDHATVRLDAGID